MTKNQNQKNVNRTYKEGSALLGMTLQFVPLYAFWLVLSEHYKPFYLISGALVCGLIVAFNHEMFSSLIPSDRSNTLSVRSAIRTAFQLIKYVPWLVVQVARDNILVAYLVLHPKRPIDPRLLGFKTSYRRPVSHVILANSITLSPGTMTILTEDNHYLVHALVHSSYGNLVSGETQQRVGKIFDEMAEKAPEAAVGYTFEEIKKCQAL